MCGIAGVITWGGKIRIDRSILDAMSSCIAHRGPDGAGIFFQDGDIQAGLVHRRLAIIDPDPRADQPFAGNGTQIVFNGEIYNFRELRRELGGEWRTQSDTEVLLRAYERWGKDCVSRLNGMYAFAIWDTARRELFLARDRMGQKPLFVAHGEGWIAFASELPALRKLPWFDATIDESALRQYLQWGYIPAPRTIYVGAEKFPPATWAIARANGIERGKYSDPNIAPPEMNDSEAVRQTRLHLTEAVRRQLVADVPIGCFLSGGIDSSIVALAMRRAVPADQRVLTFSIGFEDPRYDETRYAAAVAQHLGTEHRQFIVHPDAAADLPKLAEVFGEPLADSSALPTHYLSRATREFVKVALSGDGGDEMFGGYDRYRAMRITESLQLLPGLRQLSHLLPAGHPKAHLSRLKRLLSGVGLDAPHRYAQFMSIFDDEQIARLTGSPPAQSMIADEFARYWPQRDVVRAALAADRVSYLPDDLLAKVDRASMLHALEVRSPFMDHELARFAAGLTIAQLLAGGGKRMLREAFGHQLPDFVFKRRKMGFAVPIGQWLRTSLRPMLRDLLSASDSFSRVHFRTNEIDTLIEQHDRGIDHTQRLYSLLMLELWCR